MISAIFVAFAILLTWCFWNLRAQVQTWRTGQRALLVVAHPDDESLFFANYINSATRAGVSVHVLCLSTGNADGLGHIRALEMRQACSKLQVPLTQLILVDDPELQDGFHPWSDSAVCKHLTSALRSIQPDQLVTFDQGGVSGHPNHTSIYRAVRHMIDTRNVRQGRAGDGGSISGHCNSGDVKLCQIYTLVTHPLLLKFSGPLGVLVLLATLPAHAPGGLMLLVRDLSLGFRAMTCYWSQFVWYRLLFLLFSTYTYANQLQVAGELPLRPPITIDTGTL